MALSAVVLAWMGWQIVTDTVGHALATSDPGPALKWNSHEPNAHVTLAERLLNVRASANGQGNARLGRANPRALAAAKASLKAALLERPLDSHALALFALADLQSRNVNRGRKLLAIAGRLSWRDLLAQTLLADEMAARHDYAGAIAHTDAIMRVQYRILSHFYPALAALSSNGAAWKAMAKFLATQHPPWRSGFLAYLCHHLKNTKRLVQLYDEITARNSPPTEGELKPLLVRLVSDGQYRQAYQRWLKTPQAERRVNKTEPHNGTFVNTPDGTVFDWAITPIKGADIRIVDAPDANGKALRVEFSGRRVNFVGNVKQLLQLSPGSYRLTLRARAGQLHARRGVWWRISCAGPGSRELGHTELVTRRLPWTTMGVDFVVPGHACSAQWLSLVLPAQFDFEREIEGDVWFADLRVRATAKQKTQ